MGAVAGVEVPETVRAFARAAGADGWLAALPGLVARLERDWRITVGAVYPDATEAFVAAATLADGTPAVLKLLISAVTAGTRPRRSPSSGW
jgi:streptomycin 6-kinase